MTNVAETLDKAADLLEKGWFQGSYCSDPTDPNPSCVCVVGAVLLASGYGLCTAEHIEKIPAILALTKHLGFTRALGAKQSLDPGETSIVAWNDDPARTKQEVVDAVRNAAASLREEQAADA